MANQSSIENLLKQLNSCTATPVDNLIQKPTWGEITFVAIKPELEKLVFMMDQLKNLPLDILPESDIGTITNSAQSVANIIGEIQRFSITGSDNPSSARDRIQNNLRGQIDNFVKNTHSWIPYLAYLRGDVQRNIDALNKSVSDAKNFCQTAEKEIYSKYKQMDDILIAAREASASVGVATFTEGFSKEAENLETLAGKWLKATGWLAGITLIFASAFIVFAYYSGITTTTELIQVTTSKLLFLGILITATIWCGKIYKATKHQAAINKHRANSLKTFQAFTKAASDDPTRDAVLMETTKSIFAIASTGYLDGEGQIDSGLKIVEILKNAVPPNH